MEVCASLDPQLPLSSVASVVQRLEALGVDAIHVPETVHDSLAVALLAVEHTSRVTIRTAVTLAFVRSPTLVAYTAWDLRQLSEGRFELGLGSQIKQNVEERYGMPWGDPVVRMRDFVSALHAVFAAFSSGSLEPFAGEHYRVTRLQPYFNPGPSAFGPPPVWLGAVNAGMCSVAGDLAVGVITHPTNSTPSHLASVVRPALGPVASSPRPRWRRDPLRRPSPRSGSGSVGCWRSSTRPRRTGRSSSARAGPRCRRTWRRSPGRRGGRTSPRC